MNKSWFDRLTPAQEKTVDGAWAAVIDTEWIQPGNGVHQMRGTKTSSATAVLELNDRIDNAVKLQTQAEEITSRLKAEREAIKIVMQDSDLDRHATAKGNEALLITEERLSWQADKLVEVLSRKQFAELCPPTPKGVELRKVMEGAVAENQTEIAKALRGCAKASKIEKLELRSV